jgi:hypothetical protein
VTAFNNDTTYDIFNGWIHPRRLGRFLYRYFDLKKAYLFTLLSSFWKNMDSWLMRSLCCVSVTHTINFWIAEPVVMKLRVYIMATWAHLNGELHKFLPSACMCTLLSLLGTGSVKCIPPFTTRQRLRKHVPAASETDGGVIFCEVRVFIKRESMDLCHPVVAR